MSDSEKQAKRTILFGYLCEMECFREILSALNKYDFSALHSAKRKEIKDLVSELQTGINELNKRIGD